MATIALPRPIPSRIRSASPRPITATLTLEHIAGTTSCAPIPNKHIPVCPPGPAPTEKPDTPPQSPLSKEAASQQSILYPPHGYTISRYTAEGCQLYDIDTAGVAAALDHAARQPSPDPSLVFPWLHGLHPSNHVQQAFFMVRRRGLRNMPKCLRGIAVVKADGDLSRSRLKGALAVHELLDYQGSIPKFKDIDPREGFSIRNFHIQAAKWAMASDVIVYGEDEREVIKTAKDIAVAQQALRGMYVDLGQVIQDFNTFVCVSAFEGFEERHPDIIAVNSRGQLTGKVLDFCYQERLEMCTMTRASEIAHNVWLGPTPDPAMISSVIAGSEKFDVHIECGDLARMDYDVLRRLADDTTTDTNSPVQVEFPSSGSIMPPSWSQTESDGILETCKWIYHLANGSLPTPENVRDDEGDSQMTSTLTISEKKILIHCTDGYTESTLLALCYYTYATGLPVPEAWLDLHKSKRRNFFAYPSDVALLTSIAPRLLSESPVHQAKGLSDITELAKQEPYWFKTMDGSLPSRITDYMYLGNLVHANNPGLLRSMGIGQILSVGEKSSWLAGELEQFGEENVLVVQRLQDNGVDPLTDEFDRCLSFIARGRAKETATLVHCRVGVSRSATICIAEVMRALEFSFPEAYCFVRARRLNVIIQPHLRFAYELLRWEEKLQREKMGGFKREMEWPEIAREIAALNRPYAR